MEMLGDDELNAQNLKDTLFLQEKSTKTLENDQGVNQMTYGIIRYCLTQDIKHQVMTETSAKKI